MVWYIIFRNSFNSQHYWELHSQNHALFLFTSTSIITFAFQYRYPESTRFLISLDFTVLFHLNFVLRTNEFLSCTCCISFRFQFIYWDMILHVYQLFLQNLQRYNRAQKNYTHPKNNSMHYIVLINSLDRNNLLTYLISNS